MINSSLKNEKLVLCPKTTKETQKMSKKILFLHGFAQSAQIFSGKTGGLRKALIKQGYETIYLQGPLKLEQTDSDLYGWWNYGLDEYSVDDALQIITDEVKNHNDEIEGIIGFSQGAGLAGYVTAIRKELLPSLKFAIFFSGFKLKPTRFDQKYELDGVKSINIPNLHVIGELDTVVEESRSMKLWDIAHDDYKTMLKHQGGHFVPNSKDFVNKVLAWIDGNTKTAEQKNEITDNDLFDAIDNIGKA